MNRAFRLFALLIVVALAWVALAVWALAQNGWAGLGLYLTTSIISGWCGVITSRSRAARRRRLAEKAARIEAWSSPSPVAEVWPAYPTYPIANFTPRTAAWTPTPAHAAPTITDLGGQVYAPTPEPQPQPVRACTSYDEFLLGLYTGSSCDSGPATSGQD